MDQNGLTYIVDQGTAIVTECDVFLTGAKEIPAELGGKPVSAYAAADCDTHFIGSYPSAATGETLISFREGSEIVNFDTVDAYKSANDIY